MSAGPRLLLRLPAVLSGGLFVWYCGCRCASAVAYSRYDVCLFYYFFWRGVHPLDFPLAQVSSTLHHGAIAETMALLLSVCSLAACREGWKSLGSRCVYQTAGQTAESACAADCASVVRPWIANDTGGVPMCIRSQGEYDVLHTWVGREYWTGFRRNGASDGVTPPDDWRTGLVHPQGSACSASANPWFDSLMSHQGAWPLLERAHRCTQRLSVRCVCAQPSRKPIRSGA